MKRLVIVLALLLLVPVYALGADLKYDTGKDYDYGNKLTLKEVMQDHLAQSQRLWLGLMYQNVWITEHAAIGLIKHPMTPTYVDDYTSTPGHFIIPERRQAFNTMLIDGERLVHGVVEKIATAAKKQDWDTAVELFAAAAGACHNCHKMWAQYSIDRVILEKNKETIEKLRGLKKRGE
jgi:hypothetical protein